MYIHKLEISNSELQSIIDSSKSSNITNTIAQVIGGTIENLKNTTFDVRTQLMAPYETTITCHSDNGRFSTELVTVMGYNQKNFEELKNKLILKFETHHS